MPDRLGPNPSCRTRGTRAAGLASSLTIAASSHNATAKPAGRSDRKTGAGVLAVTVEVAAFGRISGTVDVSIGCWLNVGAAPGSVCVRWGLLGLQTTLVEKK
jgi:hypothetical protein